MDFRWGRSRGVEGIAVVIDFLLANARLVLGVGGAALLGIATLAVKRLIERAGRAAEDEKVEQKMSESWEELGLVSASPKSIRKGLEGVVMKHVAKATKPQKADLCQPQQQKSSLDEKPVKAAESQRPKRLQLCLTLQVVSADHACLLVPLQLEASLWRLIPGEETLLTHPLHWMVRRVNLEFFPRGRSYWDRPERGDSLFISMVPVLREADVVLTAQVELTQPWDSAWHLSLYPWETQRLAQLDSADQGVRRTLLKTLKAVCRHCPALRPLTAAPLANLILHLGDKDLDWSEECLSGRFQQCVWELIGYLEQGVLPSYFKPSANTLNGLTEEEIDQMGFTLYCAVSEPEILLI
ncbi:hypothetical protein J4Q44_G00294320 [Coregonus suidteri]|uniref:Mab-21-like HhH/H2TH-like domain-containing protein n=1 Tax=Coregonus suidteri TaxID=861788 RepID=A0AAN8L4W4_9TELE